MILFILIPIRFDWGNWYYLQINGTSQKIINYVISDTKCIRNKYVFIIGNLLKHAWYVLNHPPQVFSLFTHKLTFLRLLRCNLMDKHNCNCTSFSIHYSLVLSFYEGNSISIENPWDSIPFLVITKRRYWKRWIIHSDLIKINNLGHEKFTVLENYCCMTALVAGIA